jgi:SanA protein
MAGQASVRQGRLRRRLVRVLAWAIGCPLLAIALLNLWVLLCARGRVFASDGNAPPASVALVLGTSKRRENGHPNLHFDSRITAAADLFKRGKVRHLLVSGDNRSPYYNEPRDMRDALIARGVPSSAITCDFAGLRTLDSVVRAKDVFGLKHCAIISDGWHVPRALFIARKIGLDGIGIASPDVPMEYSLKARVREWLARVLVVFDLYVLDTQPHHTASGEERNLGGF